MPEINRQERITLPVNHEKFLLNGINFGDIINKSITKSYEDTFILNMWNIEYKDFILNKLYSLSQKTSRF